MGTDCLAIQVELVNSQENGQEYSQLALVSVYCVYERKKLNELFSYMQEHAHPYTSATTLTMGVSL